MKEGNVLGIPYPIVLFIIFIVVPVGLMTNGIRGDLNKNTSELREVKSALNYQISNVPTVVPTASPSATPTVIIKKIRSSSQSAIRQPVVAITPIE